MIKTEYWLVKTLHFSWKVNLFMFYCEIIISIDWFLLGYGSNVHCVNVVRQMFKVILVKRVLVFVCVRTRCFAKCFCRKLKIDCELKYLFFSLLRVKTIESCWPAVDRYRTVRVDKEATAAATALTTGVWTRLL